MAVLLVIDTERVPITPETKINKFVQARHVRKNMWPWRLICELFGGREVNNRISKDINIMVFVGSVIKIDSFDPFDRVNRNPNMS